jgi:endonuclease YncB( thermonuclease family)
MLRGIIPAVAAVLMAALPATADRWFTYEECRLLKNDFNDGDSFHVRTKSNHVIFRLYFVDAAETSRQVPERVKEQAAYWDISEAQTLELGKQAVTFAEQFLKKGFTAYSKRHDARGQSKRPRYFAMVKADGAFLSVALVEQGLARVYGAPTELPDGTPSRRHWERLRAAERKARRMKRGAWGMQLSPLQRFLQKQKQRGG